MRLDSSKEIWEKRMKICMIECEIIWKGLTIGLWNVVAAEMDAGYAVELAA